MPKKPRTPLRPPRLAKSVSRAVAWAGSYAKLADMLTEAGHFCSKQKVWNWERRGRIPGWWCRPLSEVTGIPLDDFLKDAEAGSYADRARDRAEETDKDREPEPA